MHKILASAQILDEILSHASIHTNTITARVSKIWFTRSIRFIWDTVQLNDAMSLLLPFNFKAEDSDFQQELVPKSSWERFFLYSKYIRHLKCLDIQYTTFRLMICSQPSVNFFSSTLTGLTLRQLVLLPEFIDRGMALALCKSIALSSPFLRIFELHAFDWKADIFSQILAELISQLSKLVLIMIPTCPMSDELITNLSHLPNLETLLVESTANDIPSYNVQTILKRRITVDDKTKNKPPFQSLQSFHITEDQHCWLLKLLNPGIRLRKLVHLACSLQCAPDEVVDLMGFISEVCPNLRTIKIAKVRLEDEFSHMPWCAVKMLLKCPNLHTLKIHRKVDIELENIITIAINRSFWQVLDISCAKPLSYHALVPLAQNCPQLVELGLCLGKAENLPTLGTVEMDRWFPSLTVLHVWNSPIFSSVKVGHFLSRICKNALTIEADPEYASKWKTVEKTLCSIKSTDPDKNLLLVNDSDSELSELSDSESDSPGKLSEEDNIDLDVN